MEIRHILGRCVFALFVSALLVSGAAQAKPPSKKTSAEYEKRKIQLLVDAGVQHIEVGKWCRNSGMNPQATAEFLRAVEVSEDRLQWAKNIVALIQRLDDKFWKFERKRPSQVMLRSYEKKRRRASLHIQKSRLKLAKWCQKKELYDEAFTEYQAVVALSDRSIELDEKGRVVVEAGALPEDISEKLRDAAVAINDKLYVRDAFLQKVPDVSAIYEAENERMLVRSQNSDEEAETLLAMCTALLPYLEEDMGGRPDRRLNMFVFKTRADYTTYCEKSELASHSAAGGLADSKTWQTLVCAEGLPAETVRGIALHELTHLFQYGVTRAIMPSWHSEGLAETWGGEGTFVWDGETLTAGGMMAASELEPLKTDAGYIALDKLLTSDALTLINEDKEKARYFYAESWAFLTYMRKHADEEVRERFRAWEDTCFTAALGAEAGKHHSRNFGPASELLEKTFGKALERKKGEPHKTELQAIEEGFRAWLSSL